MQAELGKQVSATETGKVKIRKSKKMIRPSSLPKLSACACYESSGIESDAAKRGTMLDSRFRAFFEHGAVEMSDLNEIDADSLRWAIDATTEIADGQVVEARETHLKFDISGFRNGGTIDALISSKSISIDLKTGQIRDYYAQMAAYAIGLMESHFTDEWETILIFCDQKQIKRLYWTYDKAKSVVNSIISKAVDPNKKPEVCDYCSWCKHYNTCGARTTQLAELVKVESLEAISLNFEAILADPEKCGKFLLACRVVADFGEQAEAQVRKFLENGQPVEGWRLAKGRSTKFVNMADLLEAGCTAQAIASSEDTISASKAEKAWALSNPDKPFPLSILREKTSKKTLKQSKK